MDRIDPHHHERAFKDWQARDMPLDGVGEQNASLIREYIHDMAVGANVNPGSKRGSRSYGRLRNLKTKLHTWAILLQVELKMQSWDELRSKERELLVFIKRMREGEIKARKNKGEPLRAIGTYVKVLKAFWHWYQRRCRKAGKELQDITIDLDGRDEKPKFNYFTIDGLRKLCGEAKYDYRVLMMFLFDSGIRAPTEQMNVRVDDLEWDNKTNYYTLNIREETSKTFGRRIKLLLCSELLREYIVKKSLKLGDYLFTKQPLRVNEYLKILGHRVLGLGRYVDGTKKEWPYGSVVDGLTMYDFRHSSACYWLPRYKSESALKYRFGWKKSDMIHYYTELLGMKDTIQEEDLYVDITKTELERQVHEKGQEINLLQEQMRSQDAKLKEVLQILQTLQVENLLQHPTQ